MGVLLGKGRKMASSRIDFDTYAMELADLVAKRGTCDRRRVGAVFVIDRSIVVTGYNGAPSGMPHCDDVGHDIVITDGVENCIRATHAEQNAIFQAAKRGASLNGSTLYVNTYPCIYCAKAIVSVGTRRVFYRSNYNNNPRVAELFFASGIEVIQL
jgi:dCMP deaminase